jgi:hypothetical protein
MRFPATTRQIGPSAQPRVVIAAKQRHCNTVRRGGGGDWRGVKGWGLGRAREKKRLGGGLVGGGRRFVEEAAAHLRHSAHDLIVKLFKFVD